MGSLPQPVHSGFVFIGITPFLHFGQLVTVDINTSLPDDVWYNSEEEDEAENLGETDNQLELFEVMKTEFFP